MRPLIPRALRAKATLLGMTKDPVCPTCDQPVPAAVWDQHQRYCHEKPPALLHQDEGPKPAA